jgi:uncharacterized protein (DUF305 family)
VADRGRRLAAALLLALAATAACDPGSARPAPSVSVVPPNGVDLLFAKMMVLHHAQAVSMSNALLARPGVPERIRNVAGFIAHDQQREIDEMNQWLQAWGQPVVDPADPAIRSLHGPGGGHGMLTDAQIAEIGKAGPDLYLRDMIEHHRGAIVMARSAIDSGANAYIRGLAKHIVNEQTAENEAMSRLLSSASTEGK